MIKKRKIKIIKRIVLVLIFLGLVFIHFIFPRLITQKRFSFFSTTKSNKIVNKDSIYIDSSNFKRNKITYTSFDKLKMTALITYSSLDEVKATIILLHGSGLSKSHFKRTSELLAKNGFNSVALDIRAYGESEGDFFTFGIKETKDVKALVDYLIKNEDIDNIGVWGQSAGGVLALQSMSNDKRIKFGIAESTYSNLKAGIRDDFKRLTSLDLTRFTDYLVDRAGSIGDFDPDSNISIKYCENITQPVLVVHGAKDVGINIALGKENFSKIKSIDKEFIELEKAGHTNIWKIGGEDYINKVISIFNRQQLKTTSNQ